MRRTETMGRSGMDMVGDEELEKMGRAASSMLAAAVGIWKTGAACLSASSPEYRAICSAGSRAQDTCFKLHEEAVRRGWPVKKRDAVFPDRHTVHGFS